MLLSIPEKKNPHLSNFYFFNRYNNIEIKWAGLAEGVGFKPVNQVDPGSNPTPGN